jgi:plasmid stability protein
MPALLIKDLPPELHAKLKREAARNHRSMNRQALVMLEQAMNLSAPPELPPPAKGKFLLTDKWLKTAKREGRK